MRKLRSEITPAEAVKIFRLEILEMFDMDDGIDRDGGAIWDKAPHGDWSQIRAALSTIEEYEKKVAALPPEAGADMSLFLDGVQGLIRWLASIMVLGRDKDPTWQKIHDLVQRVKPTLLKAMSSRAANRAIEDMLCGQHYGIEGGEEVYQYRDYLGRMGKDAKKRLFQLDKPKSGKNILSR